MISILSSPKRFTGLVGENQDHALRSWRRLHPEAEVVLYGNSPGVAEASARHDARHVPDIECSKSGVPLFNAIADHARLHARHNLQMYLNADILLPPETLVSIAPVLESRFLIVGQRIDLEEGWRYDLAVPDWAAELRRLDNLGKAKLHPVSGIDYFIFPRGLWTGLQPLIIGRAGYDSALVAFCLRRRIPVVDATHDLRVLHQDHGYSDVPGHKREVHHGTDARFNLTSHDIVHSGPNTADADLQLQGGCLLPIKCRSNHLRALEVTLRYRLRQKYLSYLVRVVSRGLSRFHFLPSREISLAELLASSTRTGGPSPSHKNT